jgi:hypothetical protein
MNPKYPNGYCLVFLALCLFSCVNQDKKYCPIGFTEEENEYLESFHNDNVFIFKNLNGTIKKIELAKGLLVKENELTDYGIQRNPLIEFSTNFKSNDSINYKGYMHFSITSYCIDSPTEYRFWFGDIGITTVTPIKFMEKEFQTNNKTFKNKLILNSKKDSSKIETLIWDIKDGMIGFKIRNENSFYTRNDYK